VWKLIQEDVRQEETSFFFLRNPVEENPALCAAVYA